MVTKDIPLDLSEFASEPRIRVCLVGAFIETLDELDQRKVQAAMAGTQYQTSNIHKWLQRKDGGSDLRDRAVSRHRKKDCACPKT
jgi:hypothetical protein